MTARLQHQFTEGLPDLSREWFTAAELETLGLAGLPGDKRSINRRAQAERWASRLSADRKLLVRARAGRGGGNEYHFSLLPAEAQADLARRGFACAQPKAEPNASAAAWEWFDAQKASVKAEAQQRLAIVTEIGMSCAAGVTKTAAVARAASDHGFSPAAIFGWLRAVRGLDRGDWLPALATNRKGGGKKAEIDPALWELIKSDWLRPEEPPFAACFERLKRTAKERGLALPHQRTLLRRLKAEVPRSVQIMARKGTEALERHIPDVRRSVESLHAMQVVNVDGHMADVFVEHPADPKRKVRPVITTIQDVYSRKILAWRVDLSENVLATRLAFADLFRQFGIPKVCLLDNSRTFASKALSAGAATRYRYKIDPEEPAGLLVSVGIEVRFAQIYHGQSKPVERAFREMGDHVWRGPECAGAYTGNSPTNKPANYGARTVPWDEFEQIVARGFAAYNAREGRRAGACKGRSCDATFAESYALSDIGQARETDLRMALLAAEKKRLDSRTGEVTLYGNRYYSPVCLDHLGATVTVRFDPDNLHREVHIYDKQGRYLAQADLIADHGFFDQAGAIEVGKRRKQARREVRAGLEAERTLTAIEVAAAQVPAEAPPRPDTTIVRPIRHRTTVGSAALKPQPAAAVPDAGEEEIIAALGAARLRVVE
ncbi:transposase domain-containing protein [Porphyrobacter sp. YT40]|uniref:transposase domain-containing protein n=1 Tax=Porphyrobacter sp. YT40 TaxID=2547601 RepID=UPI00114235A9|nr:transposase domain-containing protein [Porphyrobacter sp. YT40]QDH35827.1 DDE-type integrase/transposase/recombinase [Porphyrobacter sp. YT40]